METQAPSSTRTDAPARGANIIRRVLENPVIRKELRGRMRGRQAVILLTAYLLVISLVVGMIYASLAGTMPSYSGGNVELRQTAGKVVFGTVVLLELFLISFIGPALTSGAISSEREHQTFDLLRTTTLPARSLVFGKLASSLAYLLRVVFAALPIESLAFLLGGVGLSEILISALMMVVTAVFYCSLGMLFSSLMKRTLAATVTSYATVILSFVLLGVAFFMLAAFGSTLSILNGNNSTAWEKLLSIVVWLLVCSNPMLAAASSEAILVSDQSLFLTKTSLFGGQMMTLPSPWIPFTLLYIALSLLLISVSVRAVRRIDR